MKLSKTQNAELEKVRDELTDQHEKLMVNIAETNEKIQDAVNDANEKIKEIWSDAESQISAYNEAVQAFNTFAQEVASDLQSDFDDKSDKWQESEKGESAQELINTWEEIQISEYEADGPDELEADELDELETLDVEDLPTESML